MADSFTQIHIQLVFAVKYREAQIASDWEDELYKYITAIVQKNNHKLLQINGTADHIHICLGMRPTQALSDLVKEIKEDSSGWINRKRFTASPFKWQAGYGAFSYSRSQVSRVCEYISNQKEHHKKTQFLDEYRELLQGFGIEFDERNIFRILE